MKDFNLIAFGSDSYKQSHHALYPDGLETVYSYCEARKGAQFYQTTLFGLQYIVSRYLAGQVVTREKIEEAAQVCEAHFGRSDVFNRKGWEHILEKHNGRLPIRIMALPEGTTVPEGIALFTIENTDPQVPWLTNYLETLLMQIWSPTTVCTSSREIKKVISRYLDLTGDPAGLPFKLHDFGYRGVSSLETAALAGAAHLVNFRGTDTMAALALARDYYNEPMAGNSICATEHSVMTAGGPDGEADIVRRILRAHPKGLVAMVIDSYDTIGFIKNVIGGNRDILEAIRGRDGTVVFRPDSGLLPKVDIDVFKALAQVFGTEKNAKGYDVLPPQVRMIQGDGIEWYRTGLKLGYEWWEHTVEGILAAFKAAGISADNIAFGSGGGLLQKFNRDTQRFAIKCSAMCINGEWRDIYKAPKTDPTKDSKRGRLGVYNTINKGIVTTKLENAPGADNLLRTVFNNGSLVNEQTLAEIRQRAEL